MKQDFNLKYWKVPEHTVMFGPVEQGDWLHACGIGERSLFCFFIEVKIFDMLLRLGTSKYAFLRCAQLTAGTEGKVIATQDNLIGI